MNFSKFGLYEGRMISASKSLYRRLYPYNKVYFNSIIYIKENENLLKVWHGDLDISLDGDLLKNISLEYGKILFVSPEHTEQIVWNTTEPVPYITKNIIRKLKKENKEKIRLQRISIIKKLREKIKENYLKETSLLNNFDKIDLPKAYINNIVLEFEKDYDSINKKSKTKGFLYNKYFKEYGYLSAYILDKYLMEKLNLTNINPSNFWISRNTNKFLRKLDLKIEKLFDKNFNYSDFKRYVTCNYCVPHIDFSDININSFKDNIIYIRR